MPIAVLTLVAAMFAFQGPPLPSTPGAAISGRVVDSRTGAPIVGAAVNLEPIATRRAVGGQLVQVVLTASDSDRLGLARPARTTTAQDGAFMFDGLRSGDFAISVRHAAYLPTGYGQETVDGPPRVISLGGNQRLTVAIGMFRPAVVSGHLSDELGEPVVGVDVRALRQTSVGGSSRFAGESLVVKSDDRGDYRFVRLVPGRYVIAVPSTTLTTPTSFVREGLSASADRQLATSGGALPSNEAIDLSGLLLEWRGPAGHIRSLEAPGGNPVTTVYPNVFYVAAGSTDAATVLTLAAGDEQGNIDIALQPNTALTVSGAIIGPGGPMPATSVRLVPLGVEALVSTRGFETAISTSDEQGRFTFFGVPPGSFTIETLVSGRAWAPGPGSRDYLMASSVSPDGGSIVGPRIDQDISVLWAREALSVADQNVVGLQVSLRNGFRIRGRFEFEGTGPQPSGPELQRASVVVAAIDSDLGSRSEVVNADASGHFVTAGALPGRYRLAAAVPGSRWRVQAIRVAGREVYDAVAIDARDLEDVVVTMTDRETTVTGQLSAQAVAGRARAETRAQVALVPADIEQWIHEGLNVARGQVVTANPSGGFAFGGVRPGDYVVAALSPTERAALDDPAFVRALVASGIRVTVRSGANYLPAVPPPTAR